MDRSIDTLLIHMDFMGVVRILTENLYVIVIKHDENIKHVLFSARFT